MHADQKLYLVFEFLDVDLKRYMEAGNSQGTPLSLELCQVCVCVSLFLCLSLCFSTPRPPRQRHLVRNADAEFLSTYPLLSLSAWVWALSGTPGADRVVTYGTPLVSPDSIYHFFLHLRLIFCERAFIT